MSLFCKKSYHHYSFIVYSKHACIFFSLVILFEYLKHNLKTNKIFLVDIVCHIQYPKVSAHGGRCTVMTNEHISDSHLCLYNITVVFRFIPVHYIIFSTNFISVEHFGIEHSLLWMRYDVII